MRPSFSSVIHVERESVDDKSIIIISNIICLYMIRQMILLISVFISLILISCAFVFFLKDDSGKPIEYSVTAPIGIQKWLALSLLIPKTSILHHYYSFNNIWTLMATTSYYHSKTSYIHSYIICIHSYILDLCMYNKQKRIPSWLDCRIHKQSESTSRWKNDSIVRSIHWIYTWSTDSIIKASTQRNSLEITRRSKAIHFFPEKKINFEYTLELYRQEQGNYLQGIRKRFWETT